MKPYVVLTPRGLKVKEVGYINKGRFQRVFEQVFGDKRVTAFINAAETAMS